VFDPYEISTGSIYTGSTITQFVASVFDYFVYRQQVKTCEEHNSATDHGSWLGL